MGSINAKDGNDEISINNMGIKINSTNKKISVGPEGILIEFNPFTPEDHEQKMCIDNYCIGKKYNKVICFSLDNENNKTRVNCDEVHKYFEQFNVRVKCDDINTYLKQFE